MTDLVTGASGFLGSHLVEALVAREEKVRAFVRPTSDTGHLERLGVELAYGDLCDDRSLGTAVEDVERVYHCAASVGDWRPGAEFYGVNVIGLRNLAEAAARAGVTRFVHVSTTDVYGHPDYPADESTPYRFRGWSYGDTKILGERALWKVYSHSGLPVTVVRPAMIYGPRSQTLVVEIVKLLQQGIPVILGSPTKSAGLAYVTNVVDLLLLAADSDRAVGQAYNACDGSTVTWRQYIDRLAEIAGVPTPRWTIPHSVAYGVGWAMEQLWDMLQVPRRPLLTRMAVEMFCTDQGFPIEKACRELGYEPRVDFDEGMWQVETWLRQAGFI